MATIFCVDAEHAEPRRRLCAVWVGFERKASQNYLDDEENNVIVDFATIFMLSPRQSRFL